MKKSKITYKASQGKSFWEVTAWLIDKYRKEGNEERVQGIVEARIIYARFINLAS